MWTEMPPELVDLTEDLASRHRDMPHLDGDRDPHSVAGKRRCEMLHSEIVNGNFYTPVWTVALLGGVWHRVDGGHSSTTLAACNGHFPASLKVLIRKFHCDSDKDLADLFSRFDRTGSARTTSDNIRAAKSIYEQLNDIAPSNMSRMLAGISLYRAGGMVRKIDQETKLSMVHEGDHEFFILGNPLARHKHFAKPGLFAAMYRSYLGCAESAAVFWGDVLDGRGETDRCPARGLSEFFKTLQIPDHKNAKYRNDPRSHYVKSIHAWNAWQRGQQIKTLKYFPGSPIPRMVIVSGGREIGI